MVCLNEVSFKERAPLPKPMAMGRKAWTFGRVVRKLAAALKEHRVEVVDARLSLGTAIACTAARLAGNIPVVATNYGVDFWRGRAWLPGQVALGSVHTLVCDSQAKLDDMARWTLRSPQVAHVPNGIPLPRPEISREQMLERLGIPDGVPVVGQVARLLDFKGQDRVVEAAPRVLQEIPEAHFVLCGFPQRGGSFHQKLMSRVNPQRGGHRHRSGRAEEGEGGGAGGRALLGGRGEAAHPVRPRPGPPLRGAAQRGHQPRAAHPGLRGRDPGGGAEPPPSRR